MAKIAQENQFVPWYLLSDKEKQQLGAPWGPANPQALNRYSYVLNNPMRWVDPGGHFGVSISFLFTIRFHLTNEEAYSIFNLLGMLGPTFLASLGSVLAGFTADKAIAWVESQLIPLGFGGSLLAGVITTLIRMGVSASNIVALVTLLGAGLATVAHAYGDQGVDVYMSPLGSWLLPPTVYRQHSLWVDLPGYVSYKICDCDLPILTEKLVQYIRKMQE